MWDKAIYATRSRVSIRKKVANFYEFSDPVNLAQFPDESHDKDVTSSLALMGFKRARPVPLASERASSLMNLFQLLAIVTRQRERYFESTIEAMNILRRTCSSRIGRPVTTVPSPVTFIPRSPQATFVSVTENDGSTADNSCFNRTMR